VERFVVALGVLAAVGPSGARDSVHAAARDTGNAGMRDMPGMAGMDMGRGMSQQPGKTPDMGMRPGPLGIPMTRQGSGTSWLPDAAPMHASHASVHDWEFMVHGVEFIEYDRQVGGARGDDQFGGLGWLMGMATHPVGDAGRLSFRGMFSADPWTVTERGYPLILQSGESYNGVPLHDRQHPHDLFMELAGIYDTRVVEGLGVQLYVAPVGEPALGPVAFPHRPSASSDPFAPLSHHWQDATHISFGVISAGLYTKDMKLEGSIFNGREPDQHRADFDFTQHSPTLDSYSGRATVNPATAWSLSGSYGYLRSPEELTPDISQHRFTVSALNEHALGRSGHVSSAFVWGANLEMGGTPADPADRRLSNSALAETNVDLDGANTVFGRLEYVNKSSHDLDVTVPSASRFDIGSLGFGYVREIGAFTKYGAAGVGFEVNVDVIPASLKPFYNTRTPYGFGIFLRLRPAHSHGGMNMTQPGVQHDHMHMGAGSTASPSPEGA
jgi:hypothetical protein